MGNEIKKERIQAEWFLKRYEPENCYQPTDCEPVRQLRVKTTNYETANMYDFSVAKDGIGCTEAEK